MQSVVTLDCLDPHALVTFWQAALEPLAYRRGLDAPPYLSLVSRQGPPLLLQQVPEPKGAKNRMHLDLGVEDLEREVERVVGLGARVVTPGLEEHGFRWTVLQDPEGNEFRPAGYVKEQAGWHSVPKRLPTCARSPLPGSPPSHPKGQPDVVPVAFEVGGDGESLWIGGSGASVLATRKVRNVTSGHPQVAPSLTTSSPSIRS